MEKRISSHVDGGGGDDFLFYATPDGKLRIEAYYQDETVWLTQEKMAEELGVIRVGACQTPEIVGDPAAALDCLVRFADEAEKKKVDLLLFPECFLTGYILEEAYLAKFALDFGSREFVEILKRLANVKPTLVFGLMEKKLGKFFNSAVVVENGRVVGVYRKMHLIDPNETKVFAKGDGYPVFEINGVKYGINICYDTQFAEAAKAVADKGAKLLLSPAQNMIRRVNAEKWKDKHSEICAERVRETGLWFVRSDVTGVRPKDEKGIERIGYGPTLVMNPAAEIVAQVPLMTVGMVTVEVGVAWTLETIFFFGIMWQSEKKGLTGDRIAR